MPPGPALDAETILATTEEVLRRHGPAKATVVDVARVLGVSHAAVYRHFASKAALREAVTRRWLERSLVPIRAVVADTSLAPPARLKTWIMELFRSKRARAADEPEMFEAFGMLVDETSRVPIEHMAEMRAQIEAILRDGMASGDFAVRDLGRTANAVFWSTTAYHGPAYRSRWADPGAEAVLEDLVDLILAGLAHKI